MGCNVPCQPAYLPPPGSSFLLLSAMDDVMSCLHVFMSSWSNATSGHPPFITAHKSVYRFTSCRVRGDSLTINRQVFIPCVKDGVRSSRTTHYVLRALLFRRVFMDVYPLQPASPGIGRHLFDGIRYLSTYTRCVCTVAPANSSNTLVICPFYERTTT